MYYLKCVSKTFNDLGITHFFQRILRNKDIPIDIKENTIVRGKVTAGFICKLSMRSGGTQAQTQTGIFTAFTGCE